MEQFKTIIEISAGLLTPVIAIIAIYIACQQHKTNRDQLKSSLYNRRLKVFLALTDFIGEISAMGDCDNKRINQYYFETRESVFLFGKDINDYLEEIYKKGDELHCWENKIKQIERFSDEKKTEILEKRGEVFHWLTRQIYDATPKFEKYLKFEEKKEIRLF